MKNKNFTRFLCFFMCFCLCFAWFGPPIEANAVAIELGWVTYVIISVMAAMGITATVSGGIDALKNAVEDGFDEWAGDQKQAKITQISDYISYYEPPNGDGFDPDDLVKKLLIGAAAFSVIKDFIDWFTTDGGWSKGSEINEEVTLYYDYAYINGVMTKVYTYCTSTKDKPASISYYGDLFEDDFTFNFPRGDVSDSYKYDSSTKDVLNSSGAIYIDASEICTSYNIALSDIIGFGFYRYSANHFGFGYVLNNSCFLCLTYTASYNDGSETVNTAITIPTELSEYEVTDNQQLEVGFRGISGSFATPEEFSEAIKTTIVDTGVLPDVEPSVTEVTEPDPTPVPTPDVESDGTLEGNVSGILEWIKAIFNAILSFPKAIADLILEGIKAIFVPDPEVIEAEFMDLLEEINDKYLFDFDLDSLFGSSKEPDDITAVYAIGNHRWNLTFVSWYYLKKAVEFFRPYIRGFIVLMLIFYNLRQFVSIFGLGGVMNGDSADRRVNDLAV